MKLDPEDLRRHYSMLSDEALLDTDRTELVEIAQAVYDQEVAQRRLRRPQAAERSAGPEYGGEQLDDLGAEEAEFESAIAGGPEPDWLPEAACAISFDTSSGHDPVPDAENARNVLEASGIPCYIDVQTADPPGAVPQQQYTYRVMVPGKFNLEAVSILDQEIFNPEMEAQYRTHFEALSDEELQAVQPKVLLAGLTDRIERLTRAYNEERARRKV